MKESTAIGIIIGTICVFFIGVFVIFHYTSPSVPISTDLEIDAISSPETRVPENLTLGTGYITDDALSIHDAVSRDTDLREPDIEKTEAEIQRGSSVQLEDWEHELVAEIQELTTEIDALVVQRGEYEVALQELEFGFFGFVGELQMDKNELEDLYGPESTEEEIEAYKEENSSGYFKLEASIEAYNEESERLVQLLNQTDETQQKLNKERLLLENMLESLRVEQ